MAFSISPAVTVREFDISTVIPNVATATGAIAGVFRWGPVGQRILVDSEINLKSQFDGPSNFNGETWFSAANFLSYGASSLYVVRAAKTTGNSENLSFTGNSTNLVMESGNTYLQLTNTANVVAGMQLFYSNNTGIPTSNVTVSSVVNSSYIVISSSATANVQAASLVFRDNIVYNAIAQETTDQTINWVSQIVKNEADFTNASLDSSIQYLARFAGDRGNSLRVSVCDNATQYSSNTALAANAQINATSSVLTANVGSNTLTITITPANTTDTTSVTSANTVAGSIKTSLSVGDLIQVGNSSIGYQYPKVTSVGSISNTGNVYTFTVGVSSNVRLASNTTQTNVQRYWEFYNLVDKAPGTSQYTNQYGNTAAVDEIHVVVVDQNGRFSGESGTVLETYKALSRSTDAKAIDGGTNYYKNVINQSSSYIWAVNARTTATVNTAQFITSSTATTPYNVQMYGGSNGLDESNIAVAQLTEAYDFFQSGEEVDISLIVAGKARGESITNYTTLANYLIDNIASIRKDCVVFVSPDKADVVNNSGGNQQDDIIAFRNSLSSTSYAVMDSGYKYQYDRYNDIRRWIPLNADIAGLCARTDMTNASFWSPAGYNRGHIKNVEYLAFNPRKAQRDALYKSGINPVITETGQGTLLLGDKTLLDKPSAFNRINVRRLFIMLEKAIATAAKFMLFEFNDDFTRAQFKSMVNPYLKKIQGQRGIYDFKVICDGTNNTGDVIDNNEFVAAMYIKPARSINEVTLDFIATRTGVSFTEIIGKY